MPTTGPGQRRASLANSAIVARASGTAKIEPMVARTASTENGSTVLPTRITPLGADRVGGAHDGAEIAGIAHRFQRDPDVVAGRAGWHRRRVSRCSKTPSTVCGLSRRLIFSSTASLTAITLPPLAWAVAASRCTSGWFADRAGMDQRADRPAGLDRIGHQLQPLGEEQARFLAVLGERQPADFLDDRIGRGW